MRVLVIEQRKLPAPLVGNPDRLGQVVSNLLSHAVACYHEGAVILVHVRQDSRTSIVEVEDTGDGGEKSRICVER